jgi:hypothetical protein
MNDAVESPAQVLRMPRRRWRSVLAHLIVLLCGVIIGGVGCVFVVKLRVQYIMQNPDQIPGLAANRLGNKLDLSDEQRGQVEGILIGHIDEIHAVRRKVFPEVTLVFDSIHRDIRAVLNPEQQGQWDTHFERLKTRWTPPGVEDSPPERSASP